MAKKKVSKRGLERRMKELKQQFAIVGKTYLREKELRIAVGDKLEEVDRDLRKVLDVYEGLQYEYNLAQSRGRSLREEDHRLCELLSEKNAELAQRVGDVRRLETETKILRNVVTILSLMAMSADPQVVLGYFQTAADELGIKDPEIRGPMLDAVLTAFQQSYGVRCRLAGNHAKTAPEIKGMKDFLELLASHI